MKTDIKFFTTCLTAFLMITQLSFAQKVSELKFYNVKELIAEQKAVMLGQGEHHDSTYFYRLPSRLENIVRKEVWELGKDGAGIAIRFSTDSKCIGAKWTLTYNFGMAHMAYTGIKGLDIYTLNIKNSSNENPKNKKIAKGKQKKQKGLKNQKKKKAKKQNLEKKENESQWMYAGTAFPNGKNSSNVFVRKMKGEKREYLIYLPLYDGIEELEIGIDSLATIYTPSSDLVPKYKTTDGSKEDLPIVFYGTSVTQGGCASRPGMAYPSIIERKTGIETINLGFSGNGRMDANMADFIATIPARAYVIDCLANCTYDQTRDSSSYFISTIAMAHPDTPVYMVNNYKYPQQFILPENNSDMQKENKLWREIYETFSTVGCSVNGKETGPLKNLKFIDVSSKNIVGNEDTVDGTHLTDKGFARLANAILNQMK